MAMLPFGNRMSLQLQVGWLENEDSAGNDALWEEINPRHVPGPVL